MRKIEFKSDNIKSSIYVNSAYTYLYAKYEGKYLTGSLGNSDALYMFSCIAASYYMFDTIASIIIDLSNLEYEKGNTILKVINFFEEIGRDSEEKLKKVIVVSSPSNKLALESIAQMTNNNNIVITSDLETATSTVKKEVEDFFK